jgi:hypothetical protein
MGTQLRTVQNFIEIFVPLAMCLVIEFTVSFITPSMEFVSPQLWSPSKLHFGLGPKSWIFQNIHVRVLYLGYRGPPVTAQQPGHDQLHQQPNDWSRVPSARDDPTTPDQGGQGPSIQRGSFGNRPCHMDSGTKQQTRVFSSGGATPHGTCLTGHDSKPHALSLEGS